MEFLVAPDQGRHGRGRDPSGARMPADGTRRAGCLGRRSPKPVRGSEFLVPCDFVISAIGQSTTVSDLLDGRVPEFLPMGETLNLTRWQTVQVNDRTFETSVDGVFSGGDGVTGAATAIEAIAAGRKAAYAIDTYIREGRRVPSPRSSSAARMRSRKSRSPTFDRRRPTPGASCRSCRSTSVSGASSRWNSATRRDDLRQEATRCLECGCVALFDCDLKNYATEYGRERAALHGRGATPRAATTSHPLIELDPNKCTSAAAASESAATS